MKTTKKKSSNSGELPIIQKTYDLIVWFVPILNRLPRSHKFMLGKKTINRNNNQPGNRNNNIGFRVVL